MGYSTYSNMASATTSYDGVPNSSEGEHQWSYIFGGDGNDYSYAVAVDDFSGDMAITGQFSGTVDFGGGALSCSGSVNAVVAKYTAQGTHLWSIGIDGETGRVSGGDVAIDASGNVLVTGTFYGTIDFGGQTLSSIARNDLFVAKYSTDGDLLWADRQGGSIENRGKGIAVDTNGNVLVTGYFQNPDDIILAKYSPNGILLWLERVTGYGTNMGKSVAVDNNNNIFLTGNFYGTVDFGGGPFDAGWFPDMFVAKYSSNGVHLWSQNFGSTSEVFANDIAVDESGNVVVAGVFHGTMDLGNQTLNDAGNYDTFIVKLSGIDGKYLWSKHLGGMGYDQYYGIAIDSDENIALAGGFEQTVDFGDEVLTSKGSSDIFVTKYSLNGEPLWTKSFGESGNDVGYSIGVNADGELSICGVSSSSTIDFGGVDLSGEGLYDVFLIKLGP
jgi:hypothetical protein